MRPAVEEPLFSFQKRKKALGFQKENEGKNQRESLANANSIWCCWFCCKIAATGRSPVQLREAGNFFLQFADGLQKLLMTFDEFVEFREFFGNDLQAHLNV